MTTVGDHEPDRFEEPTTMAQKIGKAAYSSAQSMLVIAGYIQVVSGIVVYTGPSPIFWGVNQLAHI